MATADERKGANCKRTKMMRKKIHSGDGNREARDEEPDETKAAVVVPPPIGPHHLAVMRTAIKLQPDEWVNLDEQGQAHAKFEDWRQQVWWRGRPTAQVLDGKTGFTQGTGVSDISSAALWKRYIDLRGGCGHNNNDINTWWSWIDYTQEKADADRDLFQHRCSLFGENMTPFGAWKPKEWQN